jgi:hypothetical protein
VVFVVVLFSNVWRSFVCKLLLLLCSYLFLRNYNCLRFNISSYEHGIGNYWFLFISCHMALNILFSLFSYCSYWFVENIKKRLKFAFHFREQRLELELDFHSYIFCKKKICLTKTISLKADFSGKRNNNKTEIV